MNLNDAQRSVLLRQAADLTRCRSIITRTTMSPETYVCTSSSSDMPALKKRASSARRSLEASKLRLGAPLPCRADTLVPHVSAATFRR
jgi:hypothetical protein